MKSILILSINQYILVKYAHLISYITQKLQNICFILHIQKLIHQFDVICSINNSSYLRLQSYKLYDGNTLQLHTPTKQFLHVLCYAIVFRQ